MRPLISSTLFLLTLLAAVVAEAKEKKTMPGNSMTSDSIALKVFTPAGMPSSPGPAANFTGSVQVTMLVQGEMPSNLGCASVAFQPGARTAWHVHPKGQLLVVTEGSGLIQESGKPIRRIQKGDVIWTPPNIKHWHGAAPDSAMTHIAAQEALNGKPVEWMEKVSDAEYSAIPR